MESRDRDRARFIERFALLLEEGGFPRTPARVFTCVLAEDGGRLTAGELAERLELSRASVSGGVRFLTQLGMLEREREPGDRRDHYAVKGDVWHRTYANRIELVSRWIATLEEGERQLGESTPAGLRIRETRDFFAFVQVELRSILARWQERREGGSAERREGEA